jgi:peptide chain release factor subunit 1
MDEEIEQWKLKRLIATLNKLDGDGTSLISLVLPADGAKEQISRAIKMLNDEMGTATNIKSRVNRLSVLSAITSVVQKLKTFNNMPENGLVIYCGEVALSNSDKSKKVAYTIIPYKPISSSLYICDSKFHTEELAKLLVSESKYGFIIIDGSGTLFTTLQGDIKTTLRKYEVDLPKKHNKGGQSSQRFGRIRQEKRQNYVSKVVEFTNELYITDSMPNVKGLIIGGSADFKNQLRLALDQRLEKIVLGVVDISYGWENGLAQAISLSANILRNTKFIQEKNLVSSFMTEIAQDTGKICFGIKEILRALSLGAIDTLMIYDGLEAKCADYKIETDEENLVDYFALNYKHFGYKLEIISNCSAEGQQFVSGFGGLGVFLRYKLEDYFEPETMDNSTDIPLDFDADFL